MNRLRKIGNWLWLNKERMVLAVMVCFLIFRVYQVVNPPDDPTGATESVVKAPGPRIPEWVETPGLPPAPPQPDRAQDWSRLWEFSPFVYRQPRQVGSNGDQRQETQTNVRLIRIREARPGVYMAQIETASRKGWYTEGEPFEAYELLSIDPDLGCVTIYSEQVERTLELCTDTP